jgi:uncharacterized protein
VTRFDLRRLTLRGGDQHREEVAADLAPLVLGGQEYVPQPDPAPARLTITKAGSGTVFELDLEVSLHGPCFRCLDDATLPLELHLREYQDADPGDDEELCTEYLTDDVLDLSAWARDAVALALPATILCRADCAGLCPVCGVSLNADPHEHANAESDPRWAALERVRDELGSA